MILVFILLVAVGASIYFAKNYEEEVIPGIWMVAIVLVIGAILSAPNAVQYEDYTESYSLYQIDGSYYSMSDDKVTVMIMNGNMQEPKTFSSEKVSFVNGNTASIQIQGKRSSNGDLIKTLFFCYVKEKDTIENVIISVPGNSSENPPTEDIEKPAAESFCTSCGTAVKETDHFCSNCGQKIKSE